MRHFAFHTLQRLIEFAPPKVFASNIVTDDRFWLEKVWPIIASHDNRRFLDEGRHCLDRPHIRLIQIGRSERIRIDVGLYLPNEPDRYAFTEKQITSIAAMGFKVFWPTDPVAWKAFNIGDLQSSLSTILELFPSYRLDCHTGPRRRIDICVPFTRKNEAKYYFAKWDPTTHSWYVPEFMWNRGLEQFAFKD